MPTYDYKCLECGHKFEMFQSMTAEPVNKCPECGGKVKRLIGAGAGAIFKGSGFYQTDYKNSSTKKPSNDNGKKIDSKNNTEKKESSKKINNEKH